MSDKVTMPPLPGKTKAKGRDQGRSSHSRNTTPSSNISAPISIVAATNTAYLDLLIANLAIPKDISYDDILERHGGGGGIPDPKHLEAMADNLKTLSQRAEARGQTCDAAMRELVARQKEIKLEEERVKEKAIRDKAAQDAAEKESLRKAAEEEEGAKSRKESSKKALKLKKKKEQSMKEERPLAQGAHAVAKQDGSGLPSKGMDSNISFVRVTIYSCSTIPSFFFSYESHRWSRLSRPSLSLYISYYTAPARATSLSAFQMRPNEPQLVNFSTPPSW